MLKSGCGSLFALPAYARCFIAREPCREKEGISIKKIPFTPNSKHRISIHRPLFHLIHILIFFPIRIHLGINRDGQ